jgi:hypothetical protein
MAETRNGPDTLAIAQIGWQRTTAPGIPETLADMNLTGVAPVAAKCPRLKPLVPTDIYR